MAELADEKRQTGGLVGRAALLARHVNVRKVLKREWPPPGQGERVGQNLVHFSLRMLEKSISLREMRVRGLSR